MTRPVVALAAAAAVVLGASAGTTPGPPRADSVRTTADERPVAPVVIKEAILRTG